MYNNINPDIAVIYSAWKEWPRINLAEEVHAELCYAESLLLKSMLTFVEDETLVSFVKAGLKIRTCFLSYK